MEYPATQMFVNDDDNDEEDEETDEDLGTPSRTDKNIKIGVLLVDSVTYPVHKGFNIVGRIDSCNIVIDHSTISKKHAEIEASVGSKSTFISDLGSLNKTKLNDAILRPGRSYQLQDGDVLRFGSVKAVFKVEENKAEKSVRSSDRGDFSIPETPRLIAKNLHSVIPETPDLSFDKSLTDGDRSGDLSVIAGTQEVENIVGKTSSSRFSTEPSSLRESDCGLNRDRDKNETPEIKDRQDISDLETQNNISIEDSDEEDIFDMVTQQSDIHDDETQKFSKDNVPPRSDVDKTDSHSHSIEDLETQKFSNDHDGIESRSESINDLETQGFPVCDGNHSSRPSVDGIETPSESINDLETQKFSINDIPRGSRRAIDGTESRSVAINDLETQKFSINDIPPGSRRVIDGTEAHCDAINDLETQKFPINDIPRSSRRAIDVVESRSDAINDLETQKVPMNDDQDSETDEEGIFDESNSTGDGIIDLFDAPTQLIRPVREESRSPCETIENHCNLEVQGNEESVPNEEDITQRQVANTEKDDEQTRNVPGTSVSNKERVSDSDEAETCPETEMNEKKKATLNDSIESKLNHMFDDVNETTVDEPTQILTQHLEKMLESTQIDGSELNQGSKNIPNAENADPQLSEVCNQGIATTNRPSSDADDDNDHNDNDDDDNTAKVDDREANESVKNRTRTRTNVDIQVPEILSTQELFEDLPAINFFRTPKSRRRGRIDVSPPLDVVTTPRSKKKTEKSESDDSGTERDTEVQNAENKSKVSKRVASRETAESVDAKCSKSTKNNESKVENSRFPPIEGIQMTPKSNGRRKSRIRMDSVSPALSARSVEESIAKIDEPIKSESGRRLPLKKRGSSIVSSPSTPRKTDTEVIVSTVRLGTRSNGKLSIETEKRSTRKSSVVNSPKVPDSKRAAPSFLRENQDKRESPTPVLPAKTEPLNPKKKNTRSRMAEDALSITNQTSQTESKPPSISNLRNSRRGKKKLPDSSDSVSEEETIPLKRHKTSTTPLPPTVNDRPRVAAQKGKRKIVNSRELNASESSDLEINQNNSPSTKSRRARPPVNTSSTDSSRNSSLAIENSDNIGHQPSLESQEVQAILGVVDQRENEAPRYQRRRRIIRTHDSSNDSGNEGDDRASMRKGFKGFAKTDKPKKEVAEKFEKPVALPERKKRQARRPQINAEKNNDDDDEDRDEDLKETNKRIPQLRNKKSRDDVSEINSSKEESSRVNSAIATVGSSDIKSNSKVNEKEKMEIEKVKKKHSPAPEIIAKKSAPKIQATTPVRNKRGVSQRLLDHTVKENVAEEPPMKRGRKRVIPKVKKREKSSSEDDELKVSQSSSPLRRGRSSLATPTSSVSSSVARIKHKILFTGLNDPHLVSIVNNLGGSVTEKPNDCTALVTDKVRRTYKFLCGMAMAVPIVSIEWLKESEKKGRFLETGDFLLKDPAEEAKFKFNLRRSLVMATDDKLLDGYTVVLTPNTAPPPIAEMKSIIQACGGKVLSRPPTNWPEKSLIISRQEDIKNARKFLSKAPKSVNLLSVEFILTGILRHELNFQEHKLEIN